MSTLYLNFFGLNSAPFSITPDPGFFFEGKDKGEFLSGLLHAALQADGIVLVIGEVGSGKTMMSRLLLKKLPSHVDTVYLPNPSFSRDEIIGVIARDLGMRPADQGVSLEGLQQELIARHAIGRQVVVFVDEAHAMPVESIEEIRRLSNLETDDRKLVQLILCGQPELDTLLSAPHLRQVRDRVVYRLMLQNLSSSDSRAYLDHRLRVAGWRGGRLFSSMAERLLISDAQGRARRLNILADKALLAAFAESKKQVNRKHVQRAIQDTGANFASSSDSLPGNKISPTFLVICLILTSLITFLITNPKIQADFLIALFDLPFLTQAQSAKPTDSPMKRISRREEYPSTAIFSPPHTPEIAPENKISLNTQPLVVNKATQPLNNEIKVESGSDKENLSKIDSEIKGNNQALKPPAEFFPGK